MGKMISIIGGIVAIVIGLFSIIGWWGYFIDLLLGTIPVVLICGGLIALFLGVSELKDEMAAKNEAKK